MADEAVLILELEPPVPMVVADATAFEKGTILQLNDGMVVTATSGDNQVIAGISFFLYVLAQLNLEINLEFPASLQNERLLFYLHRQYSWLSELLVWFLFYHHFE